MDREAIIQENKFIKRNGTNDMAVGYEPIRPYSVVTKKFINDGFETDLITFDTDYEPTGSEPVGTTYWDSDNHTISTVLENGAILQHGFELYTFGTDEGNDFPEGSAVSVKGATGNRVAFELTDLSDQDSVNNYIGLLTTPVDSGNRIATREGAVRGIDTTGGDENWSEGDMIYVGSVAGSLTNIKPTAPTPVIRVGTVTNVHAVQGVIELDRMIEQDLTAYAKLDGSNQPFTGNLEVSKASPTFTLTESTDDYTAYISKINTDHTFTLVNDVLVTKVAVDQCVGGTATASDIQAGFPASNAFDDSAVSVWVADASNPNWLKYQFVAPVAITKYTITARDNTDDYCPTDWEIQGSNNDTDWETLDTRSSEAFNPGQKRTFELSSQSDQYEYLRIYVTDSSGAKLSIAEMEYINEDPTKEPVELISSLDSATPAIKGENYFGCPTGNTYLRGVNVYMQNDNQKLLFGEDNDASIYHDGTNLTIDTQEAGTGNLIIHNGNVGIGTSTPSYKLTVASDEADWNFLEVKQNTSSQIYYAGGLLFTRARGTLASPSAVLSGDYLGQIRTSGYHSGSAFTSPIRIMSILAKENWASGKYGLGWSFYSVLAGTSTPVETLKIEEGNLYLPNDSKKLLFGADGDGSIYHNGTNLVVNPKEVGSGILDVLGTLQTDGYNSSDGTAGATGTIDLTTATSITVKDGLITAWS